MRASSDSRPWHNYRMNRLFLDRADAGRQLARELSHLEGEELTVLALPRGGVPVGREVADALAAPLDVIVVRKLGVPQQPELAMGAIGEGDVIVSDPDTIRVARVTESQWNRVVEQEQAELQRRTKRYRQAGQRADIRGRIAVIVDDGIATGSTARAACQIARALGAARVVLAVPIAPRESLAELSGEADEIVTVDTPWPFRAIGLFYEDFSQTTDEEVIRLLTRP